MSASLIAMDTVACDVQQEVLSSEDEFSALKATIEKLRKIVEEKGNSMLSMFNVQCKKEEIYSFQIHQCDNSRSGDVVITLGAFYMHSRQDVGRNFFFKYKKHQTNVFKGTHQCVFNRGHYAQECEQVIHKGQFLQY